MWNRRLLSRLLLVCLFALSAISIRAGAQTNFGPVNLGSSATLNVNVPLSGTATLSNVAVLTMGEPNLDFSNSGGTGCATGVGITSCTVQVTFAPKFTGSRYGAVVLMSAGGVIGTAYLQGTGIGAYTVFLPGSESTIASPVGWPSGIAADGSGDLYFSGNSSPYLLYKEALSGGVYTQSVVPASNMGDPYGVAVDGAGNIYVCDSVHSRVLKETPFAGSYTESTVASFPAVYGAGPVGVAVDGSGNVYISVGAAAGIVYKEAPTATGYAQSTVVSGLPADAGIAVDGNGIVYVAVNETGGWIDVETPYAGGYTESTIPVSGSGVPFAVAVDSSGSLLIAFTNSSNDIGHIFKEAVTAGAYQQSTIATTVLNQPEGVAVDAPGNIYIANSGYDEVLKEAFADLPSLIFDPANEGIASSDSPQTVKLVNAGNSSLTFSAVTYPTDFPEAAGVAGDCTTNTVLAAGASCTLSIDFIPTETLGNFLLSGVRAGSVTFTTSTPGNGSAQQSVTVSGVETAFAPILQVATPAFSLASGTYTTAQSVSIFDATAGAVIYYNINSSTPPTTSSTLYTGPLTVSTTETIQAIAVLSGYSDSGVASATYTINPPAPGFSVSVSPTSVSVAPGLSGTTTVSVTPLNGFNAAVSFSCTSGLPSTATCGFSPLTVTPAGAVASTTLTVSMPATAAATRSNGLPLIPGATLAAAFCVIGWKRKRWQVMLLLALSLCGLNLLTGCNDNIYNIHSASPILSTVTVTATSGSLLHTTTFTLNIN